MGFIPEVIDSFACMFFVKKKRGKINKINGFCLCAVVEEDVQLKLFMFPRSI